MSTAVLNHRTLPHRFTPPPLPSAILSLGDPKRRFRPRPLPLLSTSSSLPYRPRKCDSCVASCLSSSSSSSPPPPPRTRFIPSTRLFVSGLRLERGASCKRDVVTRYKQCLRFNDWLSFRTSEDGLINAFKKFGELVEVNLVMDKIANRPRGFAFLRYATEEESKKAIEGMHGKFLDGRVIFVEIAKSRAELRQGPMENPK